MRKLSIYSIFALICGTTFAISPIGLRAQGELSTVLRTMDQHNKNLNSVQADITMVKFDAGLGQSDKPNVGTTKYFLAQPGTKGKRYVRIDWIKPAEEHLAIIGDDFELWQPRLNQVIKGTVNRGKAGSSAGSALAFMSMNREQLNANYETVYIGTETLSDNRKTLAWHIQLTPKTKTSYKMAELWIDGDGMPRQGKVIEANNDSTTVQLQNIRKNEKISSSEFSLQYDRKKVTIVPYK